MASAIDGLQKQRNAHVAAREERLTCAFRVSGAIAVASLVPLIAFPFHGMFGFAAWTICGVSLAACLRIAWLLRDNERSVSAFDALWLRSAHSGDVDPDIGDADAD
jgi:hypothetical protein